jgi:hypothetical protein
MARVRYNREHQADPETVKILDQHEADCEIGEEEEIETGFEEQEERPEEITGIDDEVIKIEELQASCLAYDAAVSQRKSWITPMAIRRRNKSRR